MGLGLCPNSNTRHDLGRSLRFSRASVTSLCPFISHFIPKHHTERRGQFMIPVSEG